MTKNKLQEDISNENIENVDHFPTSMMKFIKRFFIPYRTFFIIMFFIDIFVAFYVSIQPYLVKNLIDSATPLLGKKILMQAMIWPAGLIIGLSAIKNIIDRLNNYMNLKTFPDIKADIIDDASDYVHRNSFRFFQDHLSGAISNRITDLSNNTEDLFFRIRGLFVILMIILGFIFIASTANPIFSFVLLIWTIMFIVLSFFISKGIEPFSNAFAESRSNAVGNVVDSFANAINVILFSRESFEKTYLKRSLSDMATKDKALHKKLMKYAFIMASLTVSVLAVTIVLSVYFGSQGVLTPGDFALIIMLTFSLLDNVWNFAQYLFQAAEKIGVFKQAIGFISTKHEIVDSKNATPLRVSEGTIVFSRVKFYYNESHQLFEDKTLAIGSHEKVGLVGYSGSGKSTFVNLITRTFDIQSGEILIDNQSISSVTLKSLRDNIAFIPQDPTLFHRNLMENIRYGKLDATDEEVIEAAKKAFVHEFAVDLPNGYQTLVGERGVKLSGGQRQRVVIARAILKDAPILILDEATSALDSVTESLIQQSLHIAMANKTVIVIAHRLSTIKAMDRILVFDKGCVVEEGTHEYLLKKGTIYQNLWQVQQGFLSA